MNSADLQVLIKATLLWFSAYIIAIIEINIFNMSCSAYELTTSICVLFLLCNHFDRSA